MVIYRSSGDLSIASSSINNALKSIWNLNEYIITCIWPGATTIDNAATYIPSLNVSSFTNLSNNTLLSLLNVSCSNILSEPILFCRYFFAKRSRSWIQELEREALQELDAMTQCELLSELDPRFALSPPINSSSSCQTSAFPPPAAQSPPLNPPSQRRL